MAGVTSARLEAWAVSIPGIQWQHTYVTSSCGLRWGCWGRSLGGHQLGAGAGSSILADCLSQPNSEAGIRYLRTGVCHQTANRILYPTQAVTVAGANGYQWSVFTFGVYGLGRWPQLNMCSAGGTLIAGSGTDGDPGHEGDMTRKGKYDRVVSKWAGTSDGRPDTTSANELSALVQLGLGEALDPETFLTFYSIQTRLRRRQQELSSRLEGGSLSPERYLADLNVELRQAAEECQALLGVDRYQAIFGDLVFDVNTSGNRGMLRLEASIDFKPH